ncbi:hypothetical protein ACIXUD_23135, partial [Bacteroides fragilis]
FIQNIFKKIPFYICLLSPNALLLHPLSKRRTAFNFDMLQRRRTALQNNKNNFLFIWIIIIKVVIFAVRFAERGPLVVFSFPFAQRGLEIKDGH